MFKVWLKSIIRYYKFGNSKKLLLSLCYYLIRRFKTSNKLCINNYTKVKKILPF